MKHAIYSVTKAEVVGAWTLKVEFNDGSVQVIDFRPILAGELYGPLLDMAVFDQVRVDPEARTIVWPNGADFDPATLHDWPEYKDEWITQARKWVQAAEQKASVLCETAEPSLRVAEGKVPYSTAEELEKLLNLDKPVIQLWLGRQVGLIILRPSGVYYSNQTGGYACQHPLEEGVFVPIHSCELDFGKALSEYFTGSKWNGWCCDGIDEETAAFMDSLLKKSGLSNEIKVDRTRLKDSREAWVYVNVNTPAKTNWLSAISGLGLCSAVLTWENSD